MAETDPTPVDGVDPEMLRRFLAVAEIGPPDTCWLWPGCDVGSNGYGTIMISYRRYPAHRLSWMLFRGEIQANLLVLHECDTPKCVNPRHLFLGTNADNSKDMVAKGRQAAGDRSSTRLHPELVKRGERHHHAKLTEADVRAIRAASGKLREIGDCYGITKGTVWGIRHGKAWTHIH
jgi:hypothetical protein